MGCCYSKNCIQYTDYQLQPITNIIDDIITIFKYYGNKVYLDTENNCYYYDNTTNTITNKHISILNIAIYNSLQVLKYIDKELPDLFYYKKKCIVATVFLCNIGIILQHNENLRKYKMIKTHREHTKQTAHTSCDVINDFLKMYKLTTNDNYLLISKLYVDYIKLPSHIGNMIYYQNIINIRAQMIGEIDENDSKLCANSTYIDAQIANKFLNTVSGEYINYTNDEILISLEKIRKIICETILI
jgi:hypothetical protein